MTTFNNPQNTWNQRFNTEHYVFGEAPNAYLQAQAAHLVPGTALALADGEGRNGVWLARQGLQVDAFDFSDNALRKAQALASKHQVTVNMVCSDWQSFDWQAAHYDNIVGIFFQFATPAERTQLFHRMDTSLKPGGTLIIQGYTPRQLDFNTGGPGKLAHMYDETLMLDAFGHLDILDLRTYEADITEGTGHKGMSGLLGLTARKPLV
ncbi:SAM-dependent methyltransferase [Limnohabitans sp. 2KL-1]|uniref:SAM-dependent methyltransferase n=1 Tax=Limnohabitans sp. 2KL-1 TaxID=1100699 RepID=UPI000D3DA8AC|nr:class I SAM-dependent methyltransferase [Limnohabitans sp. 2KL-1]PUE50925.1 SAM-dependent methyltransferase [Limnohabitans sp. 2KL-1]